MTRRLTGWPTRSPDGLGWRLPWDYPLRNGATAPPMGQSRLGGNPKGVPRGHGWLPSSRWVVANPQVGGQTQQQGARHCDRYVVQGETSGGGGAHPFSRRQVDTQTKSISKVAFGDPAKSVLDYLCARNWDPRFDTASESGFSDEDSSCGNVRRIPTIKREARDGFHDSGLNPTHHGTRLKNLLVACKLIIGDEPPISFVALVDTGAEMNLIQKGILPEHCLRPSPTPFKLVGPNASVIEGGSHYTVGQLKCDLITYHEHQKVEHYFTGDFHEADITEEAILSFVWLDDNRADVSAWRYGLKVEIDGRKAFLAGSKKQPRRPDSSARLQTRVDSVSKINLSADTKEKTKRALDLFSGTGCVRRTLREAGYEVISLDIDPKCSADIVCDILEWDFVSSFPTGYFDIITASPPCTEFSRAKSVGIRDLQGAIRVVERTLDIIEYFQPGVWWLENPRYGFLSTQVCMDGIPFTDHDYCQYTDWGYKKPTRFWGSEHIRLLTSCLCDGKTCPNLKEDGKGHFERLGGNNMKATKEDKYRIPATLIEYVSGLTQEEPVARGGEHPRQKPKRKNAPAQTGPLEVTELAKEKDILTHEVEKLQLCTSPGEGMMVRDLSAEAILMNATIACWLPS